MKTVTKKFEFYSETLKVALEGHAEKHETTVDDILETGSPHVVFATGATSEKGLSRDIADLSSEFYIIGDAKEPRNALEAIKEGYLTGLKI